MITRRLLLALIAALPFASVRSAVYTAEFSDGTRRKYPGPFPRALDLAALDGEMIDIWRGNDRPEPINYDYPREWVHLPPYAYQPEPWPGASQGQAKPLFWMPSNRPTGEKWVLWATKG